MENRLIIDLKALSDNYRLIEKKAQAAVCAPVIKAQAYGLDDQKILATLIECGAKLFFLACLEEAISLHPITAEHSTPVSKVSLAVLSGFDKNDAALYAEKSIIPVINNLNALMGWRDYAVSNQLRLPVILHIDTGMERFGFSPEEFEKLNQNSDLLNCFNLHYVMSHFACADQQDHPLNEQQYHNFCKALQNFQAPRSLANSSGIFLSDKYHFDMVRPGAALYGINPIPGCPNPMKSIVTLECPIQQIRHIEAGRTVGYGATWRARKKTSLAIVNFGYADGYHRIASNRAKARFQGKTINQIGIISMDSVAFDITGIDNVQEGMIINLLDDHYGVDDFAENSGTIANEVLTSLGQQQRFQKHYV